MSQSCKNGKEMYKKVWCTCEIAVLLIKPIVFFWRSRCRPRRWILKSLKSLMTLVNARALLSIENNSSWCYNLKVSVSDTLKVASYFHKRHCNFLTLIHNVTMLSLTSITLQLCLPLTLPCYHNVTIIWLLAQVMCDDDVNFNIHMIYFNLTFKTIPLTLCFPFGGFAM